MGLPPVGPGVVEVPPASGLSTTLISLLLSSACLLRAQLLRRLPLKDKVLPSTYFFYIYIYIQISLSLSLPLPLCLAGQWILLFGMQRFLSKISDKPVPGGCLPTDVFVRDPTTVMDPNGFSSSASSSFCRRARSEEAACQKICL